MLKIAVCDDNITDLSNILSIVGDYQTLQKDKNKILVTAFHSAVDLVAAMESGQAYDLVLLDILMPLMTGMDAAKEIRQFNQDVKIIFMTSSPEFAVESYAVDAYYYALKPIWKEKFFILLDKVIAETEIQSGASLLIKSKTGLIRVYINRLEFAEVIGRTIHYHLTDGSDIETVGSMSQLEKELHSYPCFIKTHRSYIINMEHIDTLSQREIIMQSHAAVPLAKTSYRTVKSAYITFAFEE
ncbi:MAG: response regulator of the LytR/AlgR family [Caproiciproducens sp.]|jgi:DNA-binding LytR/AlgR family response regulator|nr:response regulator of the LytR/AlgR family [Caproiciproducens sp.]